MPLARRRGLLHSFKAARDKYQFLDIVDAAPPRISAPGANDRAMRHLTIYSSRHLRRAPESGAARQNMQRRN
jgi:hypothetical protein